MYFVDRAKIEETLVFLDKNIDIFMQLNDLDHTYQKATLERVAHMMLDSVLDVGNMMIDGFIMRDPGSFDDIIDILLDEKVITEEMAESFMKVIPYRKSLVQYYTNIDHKKVYTTFKENLTAFSQYPDKVRTYLEKELGPVSAFKA